MILNINLKCPGVPYVTSISNGISSHLIIVPKVDFDFQNYFNSGIVRLMMGSKVDLKSISLVRTFLILYWFIGNKKTIKDIYQLINL